MFMNASFRYLLLAPALLASTTLLAQAHEKNPADPDNVYRHYSGTIGEHKVSFDLVYGFNGSSNYGGSILNGEGAPATVFIMQPKSFEHNGVPMTAHEMRAKNNVAADTISDKEVPVWNFTINGKRITGARTGPDGTNKEDISFTESYTSSIPFTLVNRRYASSAQVKGKDKPLAHTYVTFVMPPLGSDPAKYDWLSQSILKLAGQEGATIESLPHDLSRTFEHESQEKVSSIPEKYASKLTFVRNFTIVPVYNENNLLVLHKNDYNQMTDSHWGEQRYVTIDVKTKKEISLPDMFNPGVDGDIANLLDAQFRKDFDIDPAKKITDVSPKNGVRPTGNLYPVANGMVFFYNEGELLTGKTVSIFLPWSKLKDYVKPSFYDEHFK